MKNFNQTQIFLNQLEMMDVVQKDELASLENQPTPEDVFDALLLQGKPDVKLSEAYARFRSIPFVHLYEISPEAREMLDEGLMRKFGLTPFYVDTKAKLLQIAIADPRKLIHINDRQLDKLSRRIGYKIEIVMAAKSQVDKALSQKPIEEPVAKSEANVQEPSTAKVFNNPVNLELIKTFASQADHVSLALAILKYAFDKRASEVLIEPFEKKLSLKFRIDGVSHHVLTLPSILLEGILSHVRSIAQFEREDLLSARGSISLNLGADSPTEITVMILPTIFGARIQFKFIRQDKLLSLEKIGMFERTRNKVEDILGQGYGLVLCGGLSSSGKTTTLYSMASLLSAKGSDVILIENQASYRLAEISQVEIKPELGFGYAQAMRSALAQSPDVLAVDILSDSESVKIALEGALAGKLVLAGIHSRSAAEAIKEFAALSQEPFLLASALKLVTCQALVRRICPECRRQIRVSAETEERVKRELNTTHDLRFYKGENCDKCKNGFRGRIGVFEIIEPNSEIIDTVIKGATSREIAEQARKSGMISMRQDGLLKVVSGLTTIDEVIKATRTEG